MSMEFSERALDGAQPGIAAERRIHAAANPQFNILPDKSGVPAETMRLDFCSIKVSRLDATEDKVNEFHEPFSNL